MNHRRQEAIGKIVDLLHEKYDALLDGKLGCRFECSAIMCGALSKEMKSCAVLSPRPCLPFQGLNFHQLVKQVRSFKSPQWIIPNVISWDDSVRHVCNVSTFGSLLGQIHDSVDGLNLRDFISK